MKILLVIILTMIWAEAYSEISYCKQQTHGDWYSKIGFDDFEGDGQGEMFAFVHSLDGEQIGSFKLHLSKDTQIRTFITIKIYGFDGTWPSCDYEYSKIKVDSHESSFFEKFGATCPTLVFDKSLIQKFKKGSEAKISVKGKTGVISLKGFSKSWNNARAGMNSGRCQE